MLKIILAAFEFLTGFKEIIAAKIKRSEDISTGELKQSNADLEAENASLSNRPVSNADLCKLLADKARDER